jgi:MarR family transcriptional regulator, 2-MHQ and catechol-resistance regulon repressor
MSTHYTGAAKEVRALDGYIKLMRAADSVAAATQRQLADTGLTFGQFAVLEALLHLGPLCPHEIAAKLLRSGSNVTTVLDNLEKDGLVTRSRRADDRRVVTVALTATGRRRIARIFPDHARKIAELFAALTPAEQQRLAVLCRKLGLATRQAWRNGARRAV